MTEVSSEEQLAARRACSRGQVGGYVMMSTFSGALQDARGATGRHVDTGEVLKPTHCNSWLGAIGYLVLLESIGKWARPPDWTIDPGLPALAQTLKLFRPDVSEPHALALYALRCSFAHEYGLSNIGGDSRTHHFNLSSSPDRPLVELPVSPWPGTPESLRADNQTRVNLWALGDLVEDVAAQVRRHAGRGNLRLALPAREVTQRFVVMHGPDRPSTEAERFEAMHSEDRI